MNITKTLWAGETATKAVDEHGRVCDPRLLGLMMSLNESGITVTKTGESDGFTIYSVIADQSVWDDWEDVLKQKGYL